MSRRIADRRAMDKVRGRMCLARARETRSPRNVSSINRILRVAVRRQLRKCPCAKHTEGEYKRIMRENPNRSLGLSINLSRIRVASLEAFSRAESECHSFNFNTNYRIVKPIEFDPPTLSLSFSLSLGPSKTKGGERGSKRCKYRCASRAKSANALHARIKVATLLPTPSPPAPIPACCLFLIMLVVVAPTARFNN